MELNINEIFSEKLKNINNNIPNFYDEINKYKTKINMLEDTKNNDYIVKLECDINILKTNQLEVIKQNKIIKNEVKGLLYLNKQLKDKNIQQDKDYYELLSEKDKV